MAEAEADAVRRMPDALASASEGERAELPRELGAKERERMPREASGASLPGPRREPGIVSSSEWE